MRTLGAAIFVSVAVHAAAVAFAPTRVAPAVHPRAVTTTAAAQLPAPPEAEPVEVVLLDDRAASAGVGETTVAVAAGRAARVASLSTGREITAETPATPDKPRSPLMTMRRPEIDRGPSSDFVAHFLEHSRPLVRGPDVAGEQVVGDLAAMDARLHDREHVANGDPSAIQNERIARANKARELEAVELHPDGNGTYKSDQGPYSAKIARDGTVKFKDARNLQLDGLYGIGLTGHFDTTDWIMRNHGMDPYASAKRAFLDRTRDARVELGSRDRKEQLKRAPAFMQQHLDRLWATIADPAARKQMLFELWDECADIGDDDLVSAAAGARALVVGFIHAKQVSYSDAELIALNAHRQAKAAFAP